MNTKSVFLIIAVIAVVIGGFFLVRYSPDHGQMTQGPAPATGNAIFALPLKDYSGNSVSLANFKGKPLLINSWAAWCPFCKKELVDFAAAQKEFGDKVTIIAIDRAESLETAKKYSDELGVTNDLVFLLDAGDSFYQAIGGFSMPETIFVDKSGATSFHKRGPMDLSEMRQKIQELISQ